MWQNEKVVRALLRKCVPFVRADDANHANEKRNARASCVVPLVPFRLRASGSCGRVVCTGLAAGRIGRRRDERKFSAPFWTAPEEQNQKQLW